MTSPAAIPRYTLCILLPILCGGCTQSRGTPSIPAVDLIRTFDRAEKRPAGFDVSSYEIGGITRGAIVAPVPSRAIWSMRLPHRGVFRAFAAALKPSGAAAGPVRVRIGISDDRIYEGLAEAVLIPGEMHWTEIQADLSAYAGWKWSLFYHPDRITWRIVLASDRIGEAPATVLWGTPQIVTDTDAAIEYASF